MKSSVKEILCVFVMVLLFVSITTFNVMAEEIVMPNDVVIGSDSKTASNVDSIADEQTTSNGESPSLDGAPSEEIINDASQSMIKTTAENSYYWPVPDSRQQSQGFTDYHDGLDIVAGGAVPICATMSGTVQIVYSGCANTTGYYNSCSTNCARRNLWTYPYTGTTTCNWGYGNGVVINHGNGYYSHYAHMEGVNVSVGQFVGQGQQIGTMGSSGLSTGRHLHFAIATAANGSSGRINNNPGTINYIYSLQPADTTPPTISDVKITDIDTNGFTVRCHVDDASGRVQFPTWTSANGQDDITRDWETNPSSSGAIDGNNNVAYRVNYNAHNNERGFYNVHIYAYDAVGNRSACAATGMEIDGTPPTIENVEVIDQSPYGYQIKCRVNDNNGINRVQFPTWTRANGQDDINGNWPVDGACSGTIEGDTVTYNVKDSDHKLERGEYITHIYAYDTFGNQKVYEVIQTVSNKEVSLSEETLNNHRYLLFDDAMTWKEAETKAEEMGGTLVTITSQDEQSLVERLLSNGKREAYFMGGTDEGTEGTFRWVTGEAFGLAKWGSKQPDNSQGLENYLEIYRSSFWNDIDNIYRRGYIVEVDANKLGIISFTTSDGASSYVNRNVGLTAETSGGVTPIEYKFSYQLGETRTVIQDYSESNTASFKPAEAGTYTLFVEVKDSQGRTATRSITNYVIEKTIGISYETHIQNIGWEEEAGSGWKNNGETSGTSGRGYRLEGIKINLDTQGYDVGVSYQTHIENIGWESDAGYGWRNDGQMSGTSSLGLRLEAIQIKLTGTDADKFDVYYKVHAENIGWLDWAKNGESAGTSGYGYRLEAINIVVVPKGAVAPGAIDKPFVSKN